MLYKYCIKHNLFVLDATIKFRYLDKELPNGCRFCYSIRIQ